MKIAPRRLAGLPLMLVIALGCAQNADSNVKLKGAPQIPDSPEGTVLAVAHAIHDGHPEILWTALPESYQADLVELTQAFAEKVDPTLYDRGFALVMRAAEVLDDRKEVILASETFTSTGADADEIRTALANTQAVTAILKESQVATVAGLSTIDWEQFLATTGAKLIDTASTIDAGETDNPLGDLESLTVETIENNGDRATLRISSADHEPEDVEMVRVEGRWVPARMADQWPQFVEDTRQGLAKMTPENMAAQKTQIMMFFGMADGLIEQIASLQTPEEFDAAIGPMLAPFMGAASTGMEDDEARTDDETEEPEE